MRSAAQDRKPPATDSEDEGSLSILAIGLLLILLSLTVVVTAISSVYIEQRRLQSLADQCVDHSASQVTGLAGTSASGAPRAVLTDASVRTAAHDVVEHVPHRIDGVAVADGTGLEDATTARVELTAVAHPPIVGFLVPDGVPIRAVGDARVVLTQDR